MNDKKSPYKRSIWCQDDRYKLSIDDLNENSLQVVARLMSVDAAKKNTPPIPIRSLLKIAALAGDMPDANVAKSSDVESFLNHVPDLHGAGIPTIICMLSVETDGDYPPMDRKFAGGLLARNVITTEDERILTSSNRKRFSEVYVKKVIPAWRSSLEGRSAQEADNYWGRGGTDS